MKTQSPEQRFVAGLDKAIEHHQKTQDDPYGSSVHVMTALLEVRNAFVEAYGLEKPDKSDDACREFPMTDPRNCAEPGFTPTGMPKRNE